MNFFRGVLQDLKLLFEDISDRGRFPHCRVERTDGYASCAHCGRWLKHIVWVEGLPYGSTCYATAGRAFQQAREAQLEPRRAARHAKARPEVQPPPQPEQPASDKPRTFRDEAGREFRYDRVIEYISMAIHLRPNQTMKPTAGRCAARMKDEL